jgi:hypothetical protein
MALDINKIIRESINETVVETEIDDKNKTDEVVVETTTDTSDKTKDDKEITETEDNSNDANKMCVASAISAGLGAMTLRNHLRSLNEISDENKARLKKAAKIGAGVAGAGLAAGAAYANKDKLADAAGEAGEKISKVAKEAGEKVGKGVRKLTGNSTFMDRFK